MDIKRIIPFILFSAAVAAGPALAGNPYYLMLIIFAGMYAMVTVGLCILIGYAGQISLGHAAFFALGGYTSAIMTTRYDWPLWASFIAAMVLSVVAAYLLGMPALKLKGHYLAMATLAFGEIIYHMINSNIEFTGGSSGLSSVPPLILFGIDFTKSDGIHFYYLIWVIVGIEILLAFNIINSRPGRALMSIHGNEEAAEAMGVNTQAFKLKIFVMSAALGAFAGFFMAHKDKFMGVDSAELMRSVTFVAMVAVGGMSNIWGTLVATILLFMLPHSLSAFQEYKEILYGLIIILMMIFMPKGIFAGIYDFGVFIARKTGLKKEAPH